MLESWNGLSSDQKNWIISIVGGIIVVIVVAIFTKIPRRIYRYFKKSSQRKKPLTKEFPFDKVKPDELGQKLADEYLKLTYYKNPFVPKVEAHIYESSAPEAKRRRIYIGSAEIGKTRAAYKWIMDIVENHPTADILIAKSGSMPDLINQNKMPNLAETVILFYDDINKSLLKETEKMHHEAGTSILSPLQRFEENIKLFEERSVNFYVVCTARWEREDEVNSILNSQGICKTFNIITLEDASSDKEFDMIKGLAKTLGVEVDDKMIMKMAEWNNGRSYERTVEFVKKIKETNRKKITEDDLPVYRKKTSVAWEDETFYQLHKQEPLLAEIIGAMHTLNSNLGSPLHRQFILISAGIVAKVSKRKLGKALDFLCKDGKHSFRMSNDIVSCYDYQLEIGAKKSPQPDDCLNALYDKRGKLSQNECYSLAEKFFNNGLRLCTIEGKYELSLDEWQKCVILKPDYHKAYYNWGLALSKLAKMKSDESLYHQSFEKYEKAVEFKPDSHEAYYNWGNALSDLAKKNSDESLYHQSIEKYEKAVEFKPDYHYAYNNWGNALSDLAKKNSDESLYHQSFEKYEKALQIKPDLHEAYNNWGTALSELAKKNDDEDLYHQSFEKYQKVIEIKPDFHEAYNNWGLTLMYLASLNNDESLFRQSFEKYQKALDINPKDDTAYFNMACAYALMKRPKEACDALDRAVSLNPQKTLNDVRTDSDFDPIRNDPIFQQWLKAHSED